MIDSERWERWSHVAQTGARGNSNAAERAQQCNTCGSDITTLLSDLVTTGAPNLSIVPLNRKVHGQSQYRLAQDFLSALDVPCIRHPLHQSIQSCRVVSAAKAVLVACLASTRAAPALVRQAVTWQWQAAAWSSPNCSVHLWHGVAASHIQFRSASASAASPTEQPLAECKSICASDGALQYGHVSLALLLRVA
jgi:hypothetical protein